MSVDAWLTPDNEPSEQICFSIRCPNDPNWYSCLYGAILLLADSENWEQEGSIAPERCAEVFNLAWLEMQGKERPCLLVGTVFWFAGIDVPNNCLLCDGQELYTGDYPALFAAIGYTHGGSGDGFKVPDMVNRTAVGSEGSYAVGDKGGETTVTLTEGQLASHNHVIADMTLIPAAAPGEILALAYNPLSNFGTQSAGGGQSHNNMQPYTALLPCIVAK